MIEAFFNCSIMKRAQDKGLAEIHIHNLRDYTEDKYRRVDDYPFGRFAGMVMKIEPIERCINALKAERDYDEVIFTTPDGEQFNQPMANSLSLAQNLIILCGHFKGIDYRIREHLITKEISIGLGGIMDWRDAVEFMLAGATAIQIGTANFIDPAVTIKVEDGIKNYLERHGCKSVKEIIGALEV